MKVDVIIPVYKPDEKLYKTITMLAEQSVIPHEIILLHTVEEEAESKELSARLQKLNIPKRHTSNSDIRIRINPVRKEDFDHGATRDAGARLSTAEYILFMTQDAVPANTELIKILLATLQEDKIALVYARQKAYRNASYKEKVTRKFNYPEISCTKSLDDIETFGIKTFFTSNVCAMYKRDIYFKLGGFVKNTIFNEDMIFAHNAIYNGYSIGYVAEAVVYHSHNYNLCDQLIRSFDNGVSHNQYKEVFETTKASNEGIKYLMYLIERARYDKKEYMIFEYIIDCGMRYIGFLLGKHYDRLPKSLVRKLSMNKRFWDEN